MADHRPPPDKDLEGKLEQLEEDRRRMERPDRAIPLPDEDDKRDRSPGDITGLVP